MDQLGDRGRLLPTHPRDFELAGADLPARDRLVGLPAQPAAAATTGVLLCADLGVACFVGLTTPLTTSAIAVVNLAGLGVNVANPASLTFAWQPRRGVAAILCCTVIGSYWIGSSMVPGVGPAWTTSAFFPVAHSGGDLQGPGGDLHAGRQGR